MEVGPRRSTPRHPSGPRAAPVPQLCLGVPPALQKADCAQIWWVAHILSVPTLHQFSARTHEGIQIGPLHSPVRLHRRMCPRRSVRLRDAPLRLLPSLHPPLGDPKLLTMTSPSHPLQAALSNAHVLWRTLGMCPSLLRAASLVSFLCGKICV